MKFRNGFVSNSSSSSFCIFGVFIDESKCRDFGLPPETNFDEWVEDKLANSGLFQSYGPDYSNGIYVGREWATIKDDETGGSFKDSVIEKMEEIFGQRLECGTCEEGWYDG